jgi:hypothetical protein
MRYEPNPDWRTGLYALTDELFLTRLGPDITADAKRYCPVFGGDNSTATDVSLAIAESLGDAGPEPGALRDSIEFHLRGHTLIIRATGDSRGSYAAYVELGHRIVVFGYRTGLSKGPTSFLRKALYQTRIYS